VLTERRTDMEVHQLAHAALGLVQQVAAASTIISPNGLDLTAWEEKPEQTTPPPEPEQVKDQPTEADTDPLNEVKTP
jgi:hypothetical protein